MRQTAFVLILTCCWSASGQLPVRLEVADSTISPPVWSHSLASSSTSGFPNPFRCRLTLDEVGDWGIVLPHGFLEYVPSVHGPLKGRRIQWLIRFFPWLGEQSHAWNTCTAGLGGQMTAASWNELQSRTGAFLGDPILLRNTVLDITGLWGTRPFVSDDMVKGYGQQALIPTSQGQGLLDWLSLLVERRRAVRKLGSRFRDKHPEGCSSEHLSAVSPRRIRW